MDHIAGTIEPLKALKTLDLGPHLLHLPQDQAAVGATWWFVWREEELERGGAGLSNRKAGRETGGGGWLRRPCSSAQLRLLSKLLKATLAQVSFSKLKLHIPCVCKHTRSLLK